MKVKRIIVIVAFSPLLLPVIVGYYFVRCFIALVMYALLGVWEF